MSTNQVRICVPVCERQLPEFGQSTMRAEREGDFVEIRLDCLDDPTAERLEAVARLTSELKNPVIITFRPREQGGQSEADYGTTREFWNTYGGLFKQQFL